ncbi:glycosyltransferase family 39 protein [Phenylobacterium sp.]|uniref:ArnT family glycosyltransferase n=1 Tax=Phenylobacterium sp. TaxID=1871053 RepID=UPI0012010E7B|nr:glycosyltransferase family 39 protein [Phenylobacterium sp.]THD60426.1 MAG: glycosyltransferase family 39 protein [Phenylobacterium sp.]
MSETHRPGDNKDAQAAWLLILGLTLVRLIALFRTPLELYPDEAQYWLWSRTLAFGYYSKPPVIAWAIWASTALGGDAEAWVRLPAALFQGGAALTAFWLGRRLYGARAGLAAAALYALAPAIQLSATVVATDAPLLFFLGLSLMAYVALQGADGRRRLQLAAALGSSLGLAFLSKYAAVYALIGIGLHLAASQTARRNWSAASAGVALAVFLAVMAPNLAWNAAHGFATFQHTAADAQWSAARLFNLRGLGEFLGAQFAVFGPIPFAVLLAGAIILAWRRRLEPADILLLCFTLPPIAIVAAQAFVSRANANWSGASYLAGAVLVAGWLVRWRARRLMIATFAIQGVVAVAFLAFILQPRLADSLGQANAVKRARGWDQTADIIVRKARAEGPAGLSAIAVNNRFLYYSLAYYGRAYFREPLAAPLKMWIRGTRAGNQAEASAPLDAASGQRVLAVAYESWFNTEMAADFARVIRPEIDDVWLDRKHQRRLDMFVGERFHPQPRDPATGYPKPEWKPGNTVSVKAAPELGPL